MQGPTKLEPVEVGLRSRPIAETARGETTTYEVKVRAKTPGKARCHVEVVSQGNGSR